MRTITDSDLFRKDVVDKLDKLIGDGDISENLENGILEYASKEANQQKIIIRWDNPTFTQFILIDCVVYI